MNRILLSIVSLFFLPFFVKAQAPKKPTASEIHESIKKLNFLGTVLYIAAHPDDENTSLISYLSNSVKARTGYLALTRGDGGQNLLGAEIRELLGVIRTQELLEARKIDGGEQLFTRANDFGYSKHPDETLAIWNKEEVLSDVVWVIRNFQPDIIINRFSHKKETFGKTHGHHTSSAVLSELAFDMAGDKTKYPEQLEFIDIWQPIREFFNTSWWFYGSRKKFEKADKTNLIKLETGTYYAAYGLSNDEISSLSRSMHKSQGFGNTGSRGNRTEYLEFIKGEFPKDKSNLFDGINTTWTRVKGGEIIGKILSKVERDFNFKNPSASISELVKAFQLIQDLENKHWKKQKTKEIKEIIQACAGLYLEAVVLEYAVKKLTDVKIKIEAINRSHFPMKLKYLRVNSLRDLQDNERILTFNKREELELKGRISRGMEYTSPYWLKKKGTLGMYNVSDQQLIGNPETQQALNVTFAIDFDGVLINFMKDVVYKYNDPIKGEVYRPFIIIPEAIVSITDKVIIFADENSKEVRVKVKSGTENLNASVRLICPKGWGVLPKKHAISIVHKGAEQTVVFTLTPPAIQSEGKIHPIVTIENRIDGTFMDELIEIDYSHIPFQSVLMPSESKIVRLDIQKKGQLIGYIQGAGDKIPASLRQVGYTVVELKENEITVEKLQDFDAVILGVRAYNTNDRSKFYQEELHEYVKNGGTLLVQYNTGHRLKVDKVAPLKLKISKDRVTDEYSEVKIIAPNHEVMKFPNAISDKDFEGWVQERGLYFPSEWSSEFTPILSMHDKGESPKKGSLLIAKYGKGYFIYTGLSFFRELPAGVPGAYRLYTNLLSIGKNNVELEIKNEY